MTARAPLKPAIIALLDTGRRTDGQIAEAVGGSRNYVAAIRRMIEAPLVRERGADMDPAEIRRMVAAGMTGRAISERLGVHEDSVYKLASRHGVRFPRGRRIDPAELDALLAAGLTQADAARRLGFSGPAISMHLRRRRRAGEVSPAGPSIPDTPHKHSAPISETELSSLHSSQVTP